MAASPAQHDLFKLCLLCPPTRACWRAGGWSLTERASCFVHFRMQIF